MRSLPSGPAIWRNLPFMCHQEKDRIHRARTDITRMCQVLHAGLTRKVRRLRRDKRLLSGHGQCLDFHHEAGISETGDEQQRRRWRMLAQQSGPRRAIGAEQ